MGLLTNASETSTRKVNIEIGTEGAVMHLRVEKQAGSVFINGPVVKNDHNVALLVQQKDGQVILSIMKGAELNTDEKNDLFSKAAAILSEANASEEEETGSETE